MKTFGKRYHPPGTPPGTLANPSNGIQTHVRLFEFDAQSFKEIETPTLEQCQTALINPEIDWLDITGSYEPSILHQLGEIFGLHPLALEDVLNSGQRPKIDFDNEHLFIILNLPRLEGEEIVLEQINFFVGEGHIISFCSGSGEAFEPIRQRLRSGIGRLRNRNAMYLLYTLIDVVIDSAFPVLESLGDEIEILEDELMINPTRKLLNTLHTRRRELLLLRRALWPQREVFSRLLQHDEWLGNGMRPYFSDCYDHAVQIIDLIETYREMLSSMVDIYLSSLSNKMNEVMRVLTVISTIFMPLTFIVGVYGMNFDNMPELHWQYGYFEVWGIMLSVVVSMLVYFRWKKWL